jgi:hypothetical protein
MLTVVISVFSKTSIRNWHNFYALQNVTNIRGSELMIFYGQMIFDTISSFMVRAPVAVVYFHPYFYSTFTNKAAPMTWLMFIRVN